VLALLLRTPFREGGRRKEKARPCCSVPGSKGDSRSFLFGGLLAIQFQKARFQRELDKIVGQRFRRPCDRFMILADQS